MLSPAFHAAARARLMALHPGPILLLGNGLRPRNLRLNALPFRQCSSFLYLTGCTEPDAALLLADGAATLFLTPPADDDALWHGHTTPIEAAAAHLGFDRVRPFDQLPAHLPAAFATLAPPDEAKTAYLAARTATPLDFGRQSGDAALVDAIIALRRCRLPEELDAMRAAAEVSAIAHRRVMAQTRPGRTERGLHALFAAAVAEAGATCAYTTILTQRGEILHQFHPGGALHDGALLLVDGGAEDESGYATDITRTYPVSGRFSPRQRAAYEAVLAAQADAIAAVRPGRRYRDVHLTAARTLTTFLVDEGLLRGSVDGLVERGAHAIFFPHGVGHLLGLDVHDLENFGPRATYDPRYPRSTQFGTAYLRIDLDLQPGMVVTIEPGFYVVPAILADAALTAPFADCLDLDAARAWLPFGGIRIEDDILVTQIGAEDLTGPRVPRSVEALEAVVGSG